MNSATYFDLSNSGSISPKATMAQATGIGGSNAPFVLAAGQSRLDIMV